MQVYLDTTEKESNKEDIHKQRAYDQNADNSADTSYPCLDFVSVI